MIGPEPSHARQTFPYGRACQTRRGTALIGNTTADCPLFWRRVPDAGAPASAQGGGDPATLFAEHAPDVSGGALRGALSGLTGSLVWGSLQPAPPGVPNLRPFQSAHAEAALHWLRELA